MSNLKFYQELKRYHLPIAELMGNEKCFLPVPEDWHLIVVDVESSSQAVKNGLHQEVNLAATGAIIALMNRVKSTHEDLVLPYFFGGDGATFLVPPELKTDLVGILDNYRHHVKQQFYLSLRVGSLEVREVYARGHSIRLAKAQLNEYLVMPVSLGNGLKKGEEVIKSFFIDETVVPDVVEQVDLTGMECRWNEIAPPYDQEQIVCLLVACPEESLQSKVYASVLHKITSVFGPLKERQPVSVGRLKLNLTIGKIHQEMYACLGKFNFWYLVKNWLMTVFGKYYFIFFQSGRDYLEKVSELSTSLMIDGNINSVISGTQTEIDELINFLAHLEGEGVLKYGIHTTYASVMSCYVLDREADHIHFVDGTEGGFTSAAKMFKAKLLAE